MSVNQLSIYGQESCKRHGIFHSCICGTSQDHIGTLNGAGDVPMSHVNFKKLPCHMSLSSVFSTSHVGLKKTAMSPVAIILRPMCYITRPDVL